MSKRLAIFAAVATVAAAFVMPATAAPLIVTSPSNQVPQCVTPGRLMAFLRASNRQVSSRYDMLATHYMRIGEELGIRWDYAFYQMILETGYLSYKGDVRASQNNFAGIGATGGGVPGERYASVEDGVRAHLQHLLMYAGVRVDNPVSERTRKVQSWGIMDEWRRKLGRPVTFRDMTGKWAPGSRNYWRDVTTLANRFMTGPCRQADPEPGLVAGIRTTKPALGEAENRDTAGKRLVAAAAQRAKESGTAVRSALGVPVGTQDGKTPTGRSGSVTKQASERTAPSVEIINRANNIADAAAGGQTKTASAAAALGKGATPGNLKPDGETTRDDSVGRFASNFIARQPTSPASKPKECRVWQASYGGQRAVIIKSVGAQHINYTVLDVNAKREKREIDAYIAAYAKDGTTLGRFDNQGKALAKAFELCPNGGDR